MWKQGNRHNSIRWFFRLVKLFCLEGSFYDILEEQFYLAKKSNININESGELPDLERRAYISFIIRDEKEKAKAIQGNKQNSLG